MIIKSWGVLWLRLALGDVVNIFCIRHIHFIGICYIDHAALAATPKQQPQIRISFRPFTMFMKISPFAYKFDGTSIADWTASVGNLEIWTHSELLTSAGEFELQVID